MKKNNTRQGPHKFQHLTKQAGTLMEAIFILFKNQIQTASMSPCRTQVKPAATFLVCSLIFIEY